MSLYDCYPATSLISNLTYPKLEISTISTHYIYTFILNVGNPISLNLKGPVLILNETLMWLPLLLYTLHDVSRLLDHQTESPILFEGIFSINLDKDINVDECTRINICDS